MNLRELRQRAGLTQDRAAELSGLHQTSISQLETGLVRDPQYSTVQALARTYHCTAEEVAEAVSRSVTQAA